MSEPLAVSHATDGVEALACFKTISPDLVIMDVGMPGLDGITTTEILRSLYPKSRVLAFSAKSDEQTLTAMIQAGARGYIVKDAPGDEVVCGVRQVLYGTTFFSKTVLRVLSGCVLKRLANAVPTAEGVKLSDYEKRIVSLVSSGLSTKEVASVLGKATRAVEKCRERISQKLRIRGIAGITRYAIEARLVGQELGTVTLDPSPPRGIARNGEGVQQ